MHIVVRRSPVLVAVLSMLAVLIPSASQAESCFQSPPRQNMGLVKDWPMNKDGDPGKPNPGHLKMFIYVPSNMPSNAPVVFALHGCSQSAEQYSEQSGWPKLAEKFKFYVVFPEQTGYAGVNPKKVGNPFRCFNWAGYYGERLARGEGENQSIKEMVDYMVNRKDFSVDKNRVFISGLSAGGSMAMLMLATWPEVFNAGASNAGVAAKCAHDKDTAFDCSGIMDNGFFSPRQKGSECNGVHACMAPELQHTPEEWLKIVKAQGPKNYNGPYPRVIAWHGDRDEFVDGKQLEEIAKQWTALHGIPYKPTKVGKLKPSNDRHEYKEYAKNGVPVVATVRLKKFTHGLAVDPGKGPDAGGVKDDNSFAGGWSFDAGISATYYSSAFWGIANTTLAANQSASCGKTNAPAAATPSVKPKKQQATPNLDELLGDH